MEPKELADGLWRWTAPHPDWRPNAAPDSIGDWERDVGCVLYETPAGAVFIDALVPPDADAFWRFADDKVDAAGGRAFALTTIRWHRRSRRELVDRYGASTSRARRSLPAEVAAIRVAGAGETMFFLESVRTLVTGDRILGDSARGLRLCPGSWLGGLPSRLTVEGLRQALRPLLDLPVERILPAHGPPVLAGGGAELAALL
jgi:hypothetical protein